MYFIVYFFLEVLIMFRVYFMLQMLRKGQFISVRAPPDRQFSFFVLRTKMSDAYTPFKFCCAVFIKQK